ncbi:5485_t:CDS:2 [Paraglomus brasilianum]|uniref:5485_t:CDS:1 n=1 Tax=Paraglomus brasilianum TaxID=144538 RepID=A0A9N9BV13_9GLOM|nr:5485_t:CDS:2 [Paraglomus brasilianum]
MTSPVHEGVVSRLQDFFKVPNGGVVDDPPIVVFGQLLHYDPGGSGVPDVAAYPDIAFIPRPSTSTIIPRPPMYVEFDNNTRAVIGIKILDPRPNIRELGTGYFYRTMTAKLYRQGMTVQWDFGNAKKYSRDPVNDPAGCNAPNLPAFQITIPISDVFWDPPFPIPPAYVPVIPADIIGSNFIIDLYRIQ